jgi:phosphoglycolate phosphatase
VKLIIFDFDGTMVDSRPLIMECHRIIFAQFGLPVPPVEDCLALVGKSLNVILTELVGPDAPIRDMVRAYDLLLPQLRADPAFAEIPFAGIGHLLQELSTRHLLGIATGHRTDTLAPALEALGWTNLFSTVQAADTAPSKPHPAMLVQAVAAAGTRSQDTIFVGDTTFDAQMAASAGVPFIGVDWGYHRAEKLLRAGATSVVFTVRDLKENLLQTKNAIDYSSDMMPPSGPLAGCSRGDGDEN